MHDRAALAAQLRALGVASGGVLLVHCAFSRVAPVQGGPVTLVDALRDALGPDGTLAMPSMSDDDEHVFDTARTPCHGMGIVADTFWRQSGVLRSDSPHAFAAQGPYAADITAPHPAYTPHGDGTPVARIAALDGQVLLLGVGHDANTTVHLAEERANVRYRSPKWVTVRGPRGPERVDYDEPDHCCRNFDRLDGWLGARQRVGVVGAAQARLMRARDVVDTALAGLRDDPQCFLHPRGGCQECDVAWAALDVRG